MCLFQKSNRKMLQNPLLNNDLLSLGPYHSTIIGTAAQVPEVRVYYFIIIIMQRLTRHVSVIRLI